VRVGVDIVHIPRFERAIERWGERLLRRLFVEEELADRRVEHLAGVFAAKEAFLKALGRGLSGLSWHDIRVFDDQGGAPRLWASERVGFKGQAALSISHEGEYAIAVCLLEEP